jgi:acetyl esterase/lipase
MLRRSFMLAMGLFLLAGCSGLTVLNALTPDKGYTLAQNLVYDPASGLQLDVYQPQGKTGAPVVVFFYGGRWQGGSKDDYVFVGQALASQGFVAVLPNYREYPAVRFPAFLEDCARAVRWTHDHIARYGGDPAKLVLMGHSAGAYNAAMLTLDPAYLKAVGMSRSDLKGMIGLAGPYNFLPITDPTLRVIFSPPENFPQTQPVYWVDGNNPPMLLMHGENDETVSVQNTRDLAQKIKDANGLVETIIYHDLGHGMIVASLSETLRNRADVLANVTEFVRRVTGTSP